MNASTVLSQSRSYAGTLVSMAAGKNDQALELNEKGFSLCSSEHGRPGKRHEPLK